MLCVYYEVRRSKQKRPPRRGGSARTKRLIDTSELDGQPGPGTVCTCRQVASEQMLCSPEYDPK